MDDPTPRSSMPRWVLLIAPLWLAPMPLSAQVISSGDIERSLRPGANVPYDGAPFSHRYNYGTGGFLYFGGNAQQLWYYDYADRVQRAYRFGYQMPDDPFVTRPDLGNPNSRVRIGVGIG